jgi:type VI protein secretion system component Hcp
MALNTHLHLKLDNVEVTGGVIQKGREGTIEVNSFEWSFDSDGIVGEVKFTAGLGRETPVISAGLKSGAVADALFDFYQAAGVGGTGVEAKNYTLHGTDGKVTSVNVWMLNNNDPNLMRYDTTMQYTMSFQQIEQTWVPTNTAVTIP